MQPFVFNKPLINPDGTEIADSSLGKILANHLSQTQAKGVDAIRYWDWAMNLAKDLPVHLSEADYDTLKKFISDSEHMAVIAKAQLLKCIGTSYPEVIKSRELAKEVKERVK